MDFFLIAVSTKHNLELCKRHALAGFPSTENGAWAFSDIRVGDFLSFLYGAQVHNFYRVKRKVAIVSRDQTILPPWPPLTFRETGRTVDFPFRLELEPLREFIQSIAKTEFSYVSESLLCRGGYWKTHFQADQTTLGAVASMGKPATTVAPELDLPPHEEFQPLFARTVKGQPPRVFRLREILIQSLARQKLKDPAIQAALYAGSPSQNGSHPTLEVLGEKGIPEGLIDILLKDPHPTDQLREWILEVKVHRPARADVAQLVHYVEVLGPDCIGAALIAPEFPSSRTLRPPSVQFVRYDFGGLDIGSPHTFAELEGHFRLEVETASQRRLG